MTSIRHGQMEARNYAKLVGGVRSDDVLLDIGANCGEVSRLWISQGAQAVAVEPNEELILHMASIPGLVRLNMAVVGDDRETVTFHQANESVCSYIEGQGNPATRVKANVVVRAVNFTDLVRRYRPTVIKCDTEGSEYLFADEFATLPSHVRALALEWHGFGEGQCELAHRYDAELVGRGWQRSGPRLRRRFGVCVRAYSRPVV
jgi:FkbM family methyltransferase